MTGQARGPLTNVHTRLLHFFRMRRDSRSWWASRSSWAAKLMTQTLSVASSATRAHSKSRCAWLRVRSPGFGPSFSCLEVIQISPDVAPWLVHPSTWPQHGRLPPKGATWNGCTSEAAVLRFVFNSDGSRGMDHSFAPTDRQLKASTGKHTQVGMPFLSVVTGMQQLPIETVSVASFNGCLSEAARFSGMEDQEIADQIHICHGYMSRFMRGVAQQWAKRLIAFMRVTRSLVPLQWIADQMGCDVVPRDSRAAEVAALRARLNDLERAA